LGEERVQAAKGCHSSTRFHCGQEKTIIFSTFLEQIKMLHSVLTRDKIEHAMFTGKMHAPEKRKALAS